MALSKIHPMTGLMKIPPIFPRITLCLLCFAMVLAAGCKDEKDDFTEGSFYPPGAVQPQNPSTDTTITTTEKCWEAPIETTKAVDFNQLFTRYSGWTGGDATYSVPLPDGRTLWMFGDSFIGTVNPNRTRPNSPFKRNAFVVQDGDEMTTLTGGATAFVEPAEAGWWYWPGHGISHGDTLQVILFGFKSTGSGAWDFAYASVDIATFSLPDFQLLSIERKITDPPTNYGAAILQDDGYLYLYGSEKQGFSKFLHTARVPGDNLNGEWEYFDGTGWTTDPSQSARHFANVSDEFAVFKSGDRYYLLTQHHILGGEIYLYDSDNPVSGFSNKKLLYCTPQTGVNGQFTYNAFAHPQFSQGGELLVSYNVNTNNFADLFKNADTYRPFFVRVKGWE
ncbi:MAG: DUF5005 domain-containing protein [Bacteroidetes bacterium]|nr:DUF5005 domain-containing protein [Bacteroidota bacterium]